MVVSTINDIQKNKAGCCQPALPANDSLKLLQIRYSTIVSFFHSFPGYDYSFLSVLQIRVRCSFKTYVVIFLRNRIAFEITVVKIAAY